MPGHKQVASDETYEENGEITKNYIDASCAIETISQEYI